MSCAPRATVKLPRRRARGHYLAFPAQPKDMAEPTKALFESTLHGLKLVARGKVRDIYRVDAKRLLIVATDRISAFDVDFAGPDSR